MDKKNSIEKNGFIVLVMTTLGSALNYLSQILMGRYLDVSSYGFLNSIFSFMMIVGVIGTTISMVTAKKVAEDLANNNNKGIIEYVNGVCGWMFIGCSLITIVGSIILFLFSEKGSVLSFLIILAIVVSPVPLFFQGFLGGMQAFMALGLYTLIIPFVKIVGVLVIKICGFNSNLGVSVVLVAICLGNLIAILIGARFSYKQGIELHMPKLKQKISIEKFKNYYLDSFLINILMMALMSVDVIYLKFFADSNSAGLYSSGLMFGRIVYYCVIALVSVLLPMVAYNKNAKDAVLLLNKSLIFTLALSVLLLIPVNLFGNILLNVTFGSRYLDALPYIKYASLISVSISLNTILMNYMLGIEKTKFFRNTLFIGCIVFIICMVFTSKDKYITLLLLGIIGIVIFIINYIYCFISTKRGGKVIDV